jgi:hypothetical protein
MSTIDVTINQLNVGASAFGLVLSFVSFVSGAVGLILNVLVFTRPILRREPCAIYFFSSTCFNLFFVFIVLPVRTVSNSFNIEMSDYNLAICKIEFFAFYVVRVVSCWLIAFACVDRYLHSSRNVQIRRLSSTKTAQMAVGSITIMMAILYSHMIIFYEISYTTDALGNSVPLCNGQKGVYRTFIALWHMTFYSLCPSCLMLLFGFLTLKNIRQRRQVLPVVSTGNRNSRRTDIQLVRMLTAQVLITIISTSPFSIYRLYASLTANVIKDPLRIAQENLASQIANTIPYLAHTSSFYLYTLTGGAFRKELFKIIARCLPQNRNLIRIRDGRTNQVAVVQINRSTAIH